MSKKQYPYNVLIQAQNIISGWNQIGATVTLGTLLPAALTTDITAATTLEAQISGLEAQLTSARNQRDALYYGLWDKVKRVRAGAKGSIGDDSNQYELYGGTRLSDRTTRSRKALPVAE